VVRCVELGYGRALRAFAAPRDARARENGIAPGAGIAEQCLE
jgi:hypothetical protein